MAESVLVLGESLVDVVSGNGATVERPGGSPANVAVALARLGSLVEFATAFGDDRRGALLHEHLSSAGVALIGDPRMLARTSTAVASLDDAGVPSYTFDVVVDMAVPAFDPTRRHVHIGSIGAILEPGASVVDTALSEHLATATVSYDVNVRPAVTGVGVETVRRVEALSALSDVVKASDEDLTLLFPGLEPDGAAAHLLGLGPAAVVVTRGQAGATCHTVLGAIDADGVATPVSDTIGAGDAFCAALVDGLGRAGLLGAPNRAALRRLPLDRWHDLVARANRAAAITVSRPGADPPSSVELDAANTEPVALRGAL